jgi:choline dehydrogenase-like flavoprotein
MTINGDLNSGDPTGWGIAPATYYKGLRVTSSSAYLNSPPANLTIKVNSPVSRIIFDESKRAVAVEILTGEVFRATKDIILSAGSLDTPKILLLSGIGPADDLSSLSIPLIQDLPVGKNLKDHCFITSTLLLKPQTEIPTIPAPAPTNPITSREALITGQAPMGWLSSPTVQSSAEFQALDENTKNHLLKIPTFELMTPGVAMAQNLPPLELGDKVISFLAAVMNAQSVGSVRLASSDPAVPALIDLNYLSHPYDKRVAIEALRCLTEFSEAPAFEKVTARRIEGPSKDADDETLWEHCKKAVAPVWHFAGTCKMGRDDDEAAVVDKEFRVKGVKGLRVVDLSVLPVLPNNHTQSTAYLVGETGAEKLIAEYGF